MKRILIITYYWPPSGGSGVQRWLKFSKYLPENGWEPVIYTPESPQANAYDNALLKDINPNTEVIKTPIWEPYSIYQKLFGKKNNIKKSSKATTPKANNATESSSSKKEATLQSTAPIQANLIGSADKSLKHRISLFIRGNFFIPDPRFFWINPSVKYLKRYLKEHPVDAIVSTGPPHSMHLIAKRVAKATGTKWIADFRDPWTEIFYFKHLKLSKYAYNKHRKLEQSVLDSADSVVVVSKKMQQDFAARTNTPVHIITNGFDPADFEESQEDRDKCSYTSKESNTNDSSSIENSNSSVPSAKFILGHTGIFADNGNPDYLWEALSELAKNNPTFLDDLEIRFMGQVDNTILDSIEAAKLDDKLISMGYVPHNVAVHWQKNSSVLLLPLRKEPESAAILTGKFFEYLASGSPILAFGPTEGDLAKAIAETESGTMVEFTDKEGTKREIERLYLDWKRGQEQGNKGKERGKSNMESKSKLNPKALKYSRKELTKEYVKLLEDCGLNLQ